MFHRHGKLTYAFENSPQGIKYAKRHGYTNIDLDMHISKDGVPVITHWSQPLARDGFYDPAGKISRKAKVSSLTYEQLRRLRNRDHQGQIYSLAYMCQLLKKYDLNLSLEVKAPGATYRKMNKITNIIDDAGVKAYVKGNARLNGMNQTLGKARKAGFWTRGTEKTQEWKAPTPAIDQ